MHRYYGTKSLNAKPMTRGEYNILRGWKLPDDENGSDEGYLVEYLDGGSYNVDGFQGYISWSPKDVFEKSYMPINMMGFSGAITAIKEGKKLSRHGWNGKDMFVFMVNGSTFNVNRAPLLGIYPEGTEINYRSHIDMKTVDGSVVPWVASQTDLLASDWFVVA